jgi:uncharacterized tellurite resistance protein B-like protein
MILIGTMNLTRTRERGNYYCPNCRVTQTYRLRARRPWLTLYFIPTVPIGGAETFVHCDGCRQTWDPSVLTMDQASHEAAEAEQFRDQAIRAAVLVTLADGVISPREIDTLIEIATRVLDRPVERDEIGRLCSIAGQNKISATNYVLTVSQKWSQRQRGEALGAMFLAASAEGGMSNKKIKTLAEMQSILELTDAEYEQAIEAALA